MYYVFIFDLRKLIMFWHEWMGIRVHRMVGGAYFSLPLGSIICFFSNEGGAAKLGSMPLLWCGVSGHSTRIFSKNDLVNLYFSADLWLKIVKKSRYAVDGPGWEFLKSAPTVYLLWAIVPGKQVTALQLMMSTKLSHQGFCPAMRTISSRRFKWYPKTSMRVIGRLYYIVV